MLKYLTRKNIALASVAIFTITSSEKCGTDEYISPTKYYASWNVANGDLYKSESPATYSGGFLESVGPDNNKMFIGVNGVLPKTVGKVPIVAYGTKPIPVGAVTLDIAQGVGLDWLSAGNDTANITLNADGTAVLNFYEIRVVKATGSGLGTDTFMMIGDIQLP